MKVVAERPGQKLVVADDAKPGDVRLKGRIMQGDGTLGPAMDFQTLLAQGYWREVKPYAAKDFDESKHPRDQQGKFTRGDDVPPLFTGLPDAEGYQKDEQGRTINIDSDVAAVTPHLFGGRHLEPTEFASLAGAPPNTQVNVQGNKTMGGIEIQVRGDHGLYMDRVVAKDNDDRLYIENELFTIEQVKETEGTGIRALAQETQEAQKQGVEYITCFAAGSKKDAEQGGLNGYYTWPRMGFDGDISSYAMRRMTDAGLPFGHAGDKRLSDLMTDQAGRDFWKEYGGGTRVKLELNDDAQMARFNAYAKAKGAKEFDEEKHPRDERGRFANADAEVIPLNIPGHNYTLKVPDKPPPPPPPPPPVESLPTGVPKDGFVSDKAANEYMKEHYPKINFDMSGYDRRDENGNVVGRDKPAPEVVDDIIRGLDKMNAEFPEVVDRITYIDAAPPDPTVLDGRYWAISTDETDKRDRGIEFNVQKVGDRVGLERSLKEGVEVGFHPPGGDTAQSIFIHEFGHQVYDYLDMATDPLQSLFANLYDSKLQQPTGPGEFPSRYAETNSHEAFAESFMAHYVRPRDRPESEYEREVWDLVAKEFKK